MTQVTIPVSPLWVRTGIVFFEGYSEPLHCAGSATPSEIEEAYKVIDERVLMMDHRSRKPDTLAADADTPLREMKKFQGSETLGGLAPPCDYEASNVDIHA